MNPLIWLRNTVRNRLLTSMIGRVILQSRGAAPLQTLKVVSATRLSERDFWRTSALGRSLKPWLSNPMISTDIRFNNGEGLPRIYNPHLRDAQSPDVLLWVHDDVWLDDSEWFPKVMVALARFDIVGVAGNTRISPHQPAWLFSKRENDQFVWDSEYLSGAIGHGILSRGKISHYGPAPAACQLLDGVFLAVRSSVVRASHVLFDERFDFHFYDMDFCRSARRAGLSLATWPIALTHQSSGSFGSPAWQAGLACYLKKWSS